MISAVLIGAPILFASCFLKVLQGPATQIRRRTLVAAFYSENA